jgi:hypothetical protein
MKKYFSVPSFVSILLAALMIVGLFSLPNAVVVALAILFLAGFTYLYIQVRTPLVHAMAQFDEELIVRQLEGVGIICKVVSVNIASIATGALGVGTAAVTGLTPAHRCFVSAQAALSVAIAITGARCAATGVLTVDASNPSAGTLDAAAVNFALLAIPGDLN